MPRSERVVILTIGTDRAASTRVRALPVIRRAQERGCQVSWHAASSRIWPLQLLLAMLLRPDVLVVQKVPLPWAVGLMARRARRFVFDMDDAIYIGYPGEPPSTNYVQAVWRTIARADTVTVSTEAIRTDILSSNPKVRVFPGPAPRVRDFDRAPDRSGALWLGSPSTVHLIERLLGDSEWDLPEPMTVLGAARDRKSRHGVQLSWSPNREDQALRTHAVGLAPFADGAWESRKAAYKVFEYLAAGLIPIARRVPPIEFMLGDDLSRLLEVVADDSITGWLDATARALCRKRDEDWFAARDRVFARWDAADFADLVLTGEPP